MAYKISDECVSCGTCESECPVSAISEGDGKYEINPEVCVECGACAAACLSHSRIKTIIIKKLFMNTKRYGICIKTFTISFCIISVSLIRYIIFIFSEK